MRRFFRTEGEAKAESEKLKAEFSKAIEGLPVKRRECLPNLFPCVYFIRSGEYLKIGYTTKIESRLAQHKTSNPNAELLALVPGGQLLEHLILRKFKHFRHSGEWHRIEGELKEFIDSLAKVTGVLSWA